MKQRSISFGERIKNAVGIEGDTRTVIKPMLQYTATNIATGGASYFFGLYYIPFLVYVEHLTTTQVGIIILIKSLWDAITDPVMGVITDRTRSRFGKHRFWVMAAVLPFVTTFFMTWYSFGLSDGASGNTVMWYYIIAYMLYSTASTVLQVPHTAMLPEMAPDYFLRTQYNSVGYLMNSVGMVPSFLLAAIVLNFVRPQVMSVGGFIKSLIGCFTNTLDAETVPKEKYMLVGLVLAVAYVIPLAITAFGCRERSSAHEHFAPFDRNYAFREYRLVFKNKAFRQYFAISVLYMFALGFYNNAKIFMLSELTDTYFLYGLINIIAGIFEAGAFPLNYAITKRFGKQKCSWITTPFYIASLAIILFLTTPQTPGAKTLTTVLVLLHTVMYNFGLSGIGFTTSNTYPDITDVDEMITGRRREGVIATFSTFIKKVSSGFLGMIVLTGLEWFGVNPSRGSKTALVGTIGEGHHAYELFGSVFSQNFGIKLFSAAVPIACVVGCLVCLRRFTMTKQQHTMIRAAIATRRKYGAVALTDAEKAVCEQIAGQKWETMWIGQPEPDAEAVAPAMTDGKYDLLEEEKARLAKERERAVKGAGNK